MKMRNSERGNNKQLPAKEVLLTLVIGMLLLSITLLTESFGLGPPHCPPCWGGSDCSIYLDCQPACNGSECKACNANCVCESYCPSERCCNGGCCNPATCEECVNGVCLTCGGDPNKVCCGGQCRDIGNCMTCVDGTWVTSCNPANCEECYLNFFCMPCGADWETKCCVNSECKPRCNPTGGGICTYTPPPAQDPLCTRQHPANDSCLNPGASCTWVVVSAPGIFNAMCEWCGCDLDSTYCVLLMAKECKNVLDPFPRDFIHCECSDPEGLVDQVPSGTRYICR
jgi:hypothetical protein